MTLATIDIASRAATIAPLLVLAASLVRDVSPFGRRAARDPVRVRIGRACGDIRD
jgi:hypothetical protein